VAEQPQLTQPQDGPPAHPGTWVAEGEAQPIDPSSRLAMPKGFDRIGRYHVLKAIGEGGMGVVYSAFDEELDRRVAIKVLAADVATEFKGRTRIIREAQAMAKLSHPNVVHVYEVGEVSGHVYVAMEYVRGTTLREWLDGGARPLPERLEMILQAGEGLAAAHDSGIIHRDFKPENVMVGKDGRARVLDFGLARGEGEGSDKRSQTGDTLTAHLPERAGSMLSVQVTQHGTIMGTPAYMSPEQHFGLPTDARSDQFGFCVVLYEALYGARPYAAGNRMALAMAAKQEQIQPPPAGSVVPQRLREIAVRGLRADPAARFGSMRELLAALRAAMSPPASRSPWLFVALAGVVALAVALVLVLGRRDAPSVVPSAVEELAASARLWASRAHWVYPDPATPEQTALRAVTDLRALEGDLDAPGEAGADELSREFADTLARLGDHYWDAAGGRVFARDFYAQALLFDPALAHARERSGVMPGELAELRERAERGGFSAEELAAASELAELATPLIETADAPVPAEIVAAKVETVRKRASKRRAETSHVSGDSPTIDASPSAGSIVATAPPPEAAAEPPALPPELLPVGEAATDAAATPQPGDAPVPNDPAAQRELAKALVAEAKKLKKQGKRDAALKKMFEASRADRRYAPAWDGLRDLHFQIGAYQEAAQYGEKAIKLAPGNGQYHLRVGEAYWKLKEYDAAERAWKTAQSLGVEQATDRLENLRKTLGR
jgi:serine/threonine protein kinase